MAVAERLNEFRLNGRCMIVGTVYAELMAHPCYSGHTDGLLHAGGIEVDFAVNEPIWRAAGLAYAAYGPRRQKSGGGPPRRLLADFIIGAHAQQRAGQLFTLDSDFFARHFPGLKLVTIPGTTTLAAT